MEISILCPTRNRPDNIRRLVNSVVSTAHNIDNIEFLFYVDSDDITFPKNLSYINYSIINGPRIWLSSMQNLLATFAFGEILIIAGDDIEFRTQNWDLILTSYFKDESSRLRVLFGDDKSWNRGKIATIPIIHKKWLHTLGSLTPQLRGFPYDLWLTEVARDLDQLTYLEELVIEHLHFRQGKSHRDETYSNVQKSNSDLKPIKTYKMLQREKRIDQFLLTSELEKKMPFNRKYLYYWLLGCLGNYKKITPKQVMLKNSEIFGVIIRRILSIMR